MPAATRTPRLGGRWGRGVGATTQHKTKTLLRRKLNFSISSIHTSHEHAVTKSVTREELGGWGEEELAWRSRQAGLLSAGRGLTISCVFHPQALLAEAESLPAHI